MRTPSVSCFKDEGCGLMPRKTQNYLTKTPKSCFLNGYGEPGRRQCGLCATDRRERCAANDRVHQAIQVVPDTNVAGQPYTADHFGWATGDSRDDARALRSNMSEGTKCVARNRQGQDSLGTFPRTLAPPGWFRILTYSLTTIPMFGMTFCFYSVLLKGASHA